MRVSFNEIETTLRKAATGSGFPMGLAEDCGCAAAWLAARNHNGIAAVLDAIRDGMRKPVMPPADGRDWVFADARIATCGPSAIGLLVGEPTCHDIHLHNTDSPLLMLGLAGVAAGDYRLDFALELGARCTALISANGMSLTGTLPPPGAQLFLTFRENGGGETRNTIQMQGAIVDDGLWQEALALAAQTYVPASDASRAGGAGAGLTDND